MNVLGTIDKNSTAWHHWADRLHWWKKISLAVLDQGLISGTNFTLGILLARWLSPEEYGIYALCFSAYLLISSIQQALVLEPMSVLGPIHYQDRYRTYVGILVLLQPVLGLMFALSLQMAVWLGSLAHPNAHFAAATGGLSVGVPLILLSNLLRSACYMRLNSQTAAKAAVVYAAVVLCGSIAAHRYGAITSKHAFLIMGGGSAVASAYLLVALKPILPSTHALSLMRDVCSSHWKYGRWALGTGGVTWLWENSWYMMTAALLTARDVGGLKAVGNLILPLTHTTAACSRLAQPYVSGMSDRHGGNATARPAWRFGLVLAVGTLAYSFVVTLFSKPIFGLLYQGKFVEYAHLFPWLGVNFAFTVLSQNGLGMGLRALQSPSSVFTAIGAGAVVAIALGIPAGRMFGLEGIIGVSILASAMTLTLSARLFRTKLRQSNLSVALVED